MPEGLVAWTSTISNFSCCSCLKGWNPIFKLRTNREIKEKVTLDRVFSKYGIASRADARKEITSGRVTVNGKRVRDPELWVSLSSDSVRWNGLALLDQKKIYLMLYKPRGVVTSHGDPHQRRTIYDLLIETEKWVFPVGRLDMNTSGLLLLTNDTKFGEELTNPLSKIPKTYQLKINFHPTPDQLQTLKEGVSLKNGERTLPAKVRILRNTEKHTHLQIMIIEGKNRQIRRMIESLGGRVLKLVRTRIGNLALGDLQVGGYRKLNSKDFLELRMGPPEWK